MDLAALIAEFRARRDDLERPYLWSDDEIVSYLNEAITEACERARLIEDRTTPEVCRIRLQDGVATYQLHESVFKVKRVVHDGNSLIEASVEDMDAMYHDWENDEGAAPKYFILENDTGIRVYPTPTVSGEILYLTVYRDVLDRLDPAKPDQVPEIHAKHHLRIMPWAYRCALLKRDSQTLDPEGAATEEAVFVANFGRRLDANVVRKQRDVAPNIVRSVW